MLQLLTDTMSRSEKLLDEALRYCAVLNVCRDLYLNGNELQSQGVIDLVHVLVQQAVKDDADRQEEDRRKAVEAIQAARLGLVVLALCLQETLLNGYIAVMCSSRAWSIRTGTFELLIVGKKPTDFMPIL